MVAYGQSEQAGSVDAIASCCVPVVKPPPSDADLPPRKSRQGCNSSWLTRHQSTSPHQRCLPSRVLHGAILHHHIHMFWAGSGVFHASPRHAARHVPSAMQFPKPGACSTPVNSPALPPRLPFSLWSLVFCLLWLNDGANLALGADTGRAVSCGEPGVKCLAGHAEGETWLQFHRRLDGHLVGKGAKQRMRMRMKGLLKTNPSGLVSRGCRGTRHALRGTLPASCVASLPLPPCSVPLPGAFSLFFLLESGSAPQLLGAARSLLSPGQRFAVPCPSRGPVTVSRGMEPCCAQQELFLFAL